jgi:hypothetical protein
MISYRTLILPVLVVTGCASRNADVDLRKEKEMLLAMHKKGRAAHFNLDAVAMASVAADSVITVYGGKIGRVTKEQTVARFTRSFEGAEYSKWDDLEEPIIRISDDGTLAWMITRLEVKRTKRDSTGKAVPEAFIYAGITTYKKTERGWVREANVSTFEETL